MAGQKIEQAQTLVQIDVAEIGRLQGEAFERGGQLAVGLIALYHDGLKEAHAHIDTLVSRCVDMAGTVSTCAEKTAQVTVIEAQKQVAIARERASADLMTEAIRAVGPVAAPLLERAVKRLAAGSGGPEAGEGAKRALLKMFSDDDLCARIQTVVGTEDFVDLTRLAGGL